MRMLLGVLYVHSRKRSLTRTVSIQAAMLNPSSGGPCHPHDTTVRVFTASWDTFGFMGGNTGLACKEMAMAMAMAARFGLIRLSKAEASGQAPSSLAEFLKFRFSAVNLWKDHGVWTFHAWFYAKVHPRRQRNAANATTPQALNA